MNKEEETITTVAQEGEEGDVVQGQDNVQPARKMEDSLGQQGK